MGEAEASTIGPVQLPFNVSRMRWRRAEGLKGTFELSDDTGNPDHKAHCTKFAEKYPDLQAFLDTFLMKSENLTWYHITHHLLYEQAEEKEEKLLKCSCCDGTLPSEDFQAFKACSMCSAEFLVWLQERKEQPSPAEATQTVVCQMCHASLLLIHDSEGKHRIVLKQRRV